jgi:ABC-2 type transport system ATP-binding protein
MNKILAVKNLKKIFKGGTIAVDDISFDVYKNEVFGLIGPNGSGKTTTLRMLTTLLKPTKGDIYFGGNKLSAINAEKLRSKIGYVPQGDCLYGDLKVLENLDIFSKPYSIEEEKRQRNIYYLLNKMEINNRKNDFVRNLSGGLTKRVSITSALIHEPEILFFDEVTMGLDPNSRLHIWQLIKDLKKTTTIILTTHYMDEAESICDRIAILSQGKILELDKPKEIIKKYRAHDLNQVIGEIIEREK